MLNDCGYNTNLINDMKKGKMPSADKIVTIAKYLGVSVEYIMGAGEVSVGDTSNEENIEKKFTATEFEELAMDYAVMDAKKRKQLVEYAKFLKIQEEFSNELNSLGEELTSNLKEKRLKLRKEKGGLKL